jgi:RNA polymerase primary sigma factor
VEGFDPAMNTRFSTYATYWIKQSMKRALINTSKLVRLPAYLFDLLAKWNRAAARLQDRLGRTPTPEEVARRLKLSKKKIKIVEKALRIYHAGQEGERPGNEGSMEETLKDPRCWTPDFPVIQRDEREQILGLVQEMDPREATILRLRFGLDGQDPITLKEIGERLSLTRERVRQIEVEALGKLRECVLAK